MVRPWRLVVLLSLALGTLSSGPAPSERAAPTVAVVAADAEAEPPQERVMPQKDVAVAEEAGPPVNSEPVIDALERKIAQIRSNHDAERPPVEESSPAVLKSAADAAVPTFPSHPGAKSEDATKVVAAPAVAAVKEVDQEVVAAVETRSENSPGTSMEKAADKKKQPAEGTKTKATVQKDAAAFKLADSIATSNAEVGTSSKKSGKGKAAGGANRTAAQKASETPAAVVETAAQKASETPAAVVETPAAVEDPAALSKPQPAKAPSAKSVKDAIAADEIVKADAGAPKEHAASKDSGASTRTTSVKVEKELEEKTAAKEEDAFKLAQGPEEATEEEVAAKAAAEALDRETRQALMKKPKHPEPEGQPTSGSAGAAPAARETSNPTAGVEGAREGGGGKAGKEVETEAPAPVVAPIAAKTVAASANTETAPVVVSPAAKKAGGKAGAHAGKHGGGGGSDARVAGEASKQGEAHPKPATKCTAGFSFVSSKGCLPCPKGTSSESGEACVPCTAGNFAYELGSGECQPCEDGSISREGSLQCVLCASGKHATDDSTRCLTCPVGHWSNAGETQCGLCPPGTYNSKEGQPGCKDCGAGMYNPNRGASHYEDCLPCPIGHMCPDTASKAPLPCSDYTYADGLSGVTCKSCPLLFQANSGNKGCTPEPSFYMLVFAALMGMGTVVYALVQCPRQKWGDDFYVYLSKV